MVLDNDFDTYAILHVSGHSAVFNHLEPLTTLLAVKAACARKIRPANPIARKRASYPRGNSFLISYLTYFYVICEIWNRAMDGL